MHEIWKMTLRKERLIAYFILVTFIKFNPEQWQFWGVVFMMALILDKFEDSVRKEYNDSTKDKLIRLMEGQEDDGNTN